MAGFRTRATVLAVATATALACAAPATAFAADIQQLSFAYSEALRGYETALDEQEQNAHEIAALEQQIHETELAIERSEGELGETAVSLYKGLNRQVPLLDLILGSSDFHEAVVRYDMYERVERYCVERMQQLEAEQTQLNQTHDELEQRKLEIESKVADAKQAAEAAEKALRDAQHEDGANYHQAQGNNENCGATAFIVAVNTLLHENRYTDNVEVWSSPSFNRDSTANLVAKGNSWLLANGLANDIAMEYIPGDLKTTDQLIAELNEGHVVVMSSGPSSVWQRADGSETSSSAFPGGHYMMCYHYADGKFYCNDSSVKAEKGAGVAYDEEQMQQWLSGRSYHFAVSMYNK